MSKKNAYNSILTNFLLRWGIETNLKAMKKYLQIWQATPLYVKLKEAKHNIKS